MNIAGTYVVSVIFSGSPREYDYLCPADRAVAVGDVVQVSTRRGLAEVIVVAVKPASERATAFIEPEQVAR